MTGDTIRREDLIEWVRSAGRGKTWRPMWEQPGTRPGESGGKEADKPGSARWVCGGVLCWHERTRQLRRCPRLRR